MSFHAVGIADSNNITADEFCAIYIWQLQPHPDGVKQQKIPNLINRLVRKYRLNPDTADDLKMELHCKAMELAHERWNTTKWDNHTKEFLEPITSVGLMLSNIEQQLKRTADEFITREFSHGMVNHNTESERLEWMEAKEAHGGREAMFVSRNYADTVGDDDEATADSLDAIDHQISQNSMINTTEEQLVTEDEWEYLQWVKQHAKSYLSKKQREVFESREEKGLSPDQVATKLKMSRQAVDTNLSRAKEKLRELRKTALSYEAFDAARLNKRS